MVPMLPPWMIERLNEAEKAQQERFRRDDAARPRVYAPEPARQPEPKHEEPRSVYRIEL